MENKINGMITAGLLLPRKLEAGQEGKDVLNVLNSHLRTVKAWEEMVIPSFRITDSIINSLNSARRTGRLIRGFEDAEKKLSAERSGIASIEVKTGTRRMERISRLVVVANDGSERFYRQTKKLVEQNRPRVLEILLDINSFELGEMIFGPGKRALFLLVNHKDAAVKFLISLIK